MNEEELKTVFEDQKQKDIDMLNAEEVERLKIKFAHDRVVFETGINGKKDACI